MEEYKKALDCRKEGNLKKGFALLQELSDAGNLYAKFELYKTYHNGGWGVYACESKCDQNLVNEVLDHEFLALAYVCFESNRVFVGTLMQLIDITTTREEIALASCAIALQCRMHFFYRERYSWLQKGSAESCAECLEQLFKIDDKWNYLVQAYTQKNTGACKDVFYYYWNLKYYKEAFDVYNACTALQDRTMISMDVLAIRQNDLDAKYFIGKLAPSTFTSKEVEDARNYYKLRHLRVRKAVLRWMSIAKRINFYRDVAFIIGKLVFDSREDDSVWEKKQSARARLKRAKVVIKI